MQKTVKRLLIVDDDLDILESLCIILEEEGYEVVASDKGDCLEQLCNNRLPHLILLDVLLPGKDGRALVKHLKSQLETMHVPVIMFSARPSVCETALQAGAEEFLAKPFDINELLAKIAHFLK